MGTKELSIINPTIFCNLCSVKRCVISISVLKGRFIDSP